MFLDLHIEELTVLSNVLEDYKSKGLCNQLSLSDDALFHNVLHKVDTILSE